MFFENEGVQNAVLADLLLKGVDYDLATKLIKTSGDMIYIYKQSGLEIPEQFLVKNEDNPISNPDNQLKTHVRTISGESLGSREPIIEIATVKQTLLSKFQEKYEKLSFKQKPLNLIYQSSDIQGPERFSYEGFRESFDDEDAIDEESKNEVNYFDTKTIPIIKVKLDNMRNVLKNLISANEDINVIDIEKFQMLDFCY